jgi:hypothetical protein
MFCFLGIISFGGLLMAMCFSRPFFLFADMGGVLSILAYWQSDLVINLFFSSPIFGTLGEIERKGQWWCRWLGEGAISLLSCCSFLPL